jgi:hypothetical protein
VPLPPGDRNVGPAQAHAQPWLGLPAILITELADIIRAIVHEEVERRQPPNPKVYTKREVCSLFGLSETSVDELVKDG